jgi:hypothetical protein
MLGVIVILFAAFVILRPAPAGKTSKPAVPASQH